MKGPTPMKNNGWIEVRRPIAAMILLLALGIGGVAGLWITGRRSSQGVNILLSTASAAVSDRSEEHTSELQSRLHLVCRLLLEKKKNNHPTTTRMNNS